MNIMIAIDGPAGAGKSTISKIVAQRLNINYIDTGAMYRALTLKVLKHNLNIHDQQAIIKLLNNTKIDFKSNHIYLDNKKVDHEIRNVKVNSYVSDIAKIRGVRERLVQIQKKITLNKSVIMDGRDIGSYVLPDANYKFYLTASVTERARRRYKQLKEKDNTITMENIIREITRRDTIDSTRKFAPLIKGADAIEIDTTDKTIEETVEEIIEHIYKGGYI